MNSDEDIEYAGFGRRLTALIIDTIIIALFTFGLVAAILGLDYFQIQGTPEALAQYPNSYFIELFINNVLPAIFVVFMWVKFMATPGKMLLDCYVVDARTGKSITTLQAILRYISYLISALPLLLGFFWMLWDKRNQCFHDKIAKTVVIRGNEHTEDSLETLENKLL